MALNAYLKMEGEKLGPIVGGVTQKGREGSILVVAFNHEIVSPRDAASGLPTGKRQHKPFVITKELDKASPLIAHALVQNEIIKKFRLDFWRPSGTGAEVQYYTVELFNASVASFREEMLDNGYEENRRLHEREHVAFVYEKITWTWQDGG